MGAIFAEMNFQHIFDRFDVFFIDEIRARGWEFLIHAGEGKFYIEHLVRKFYGSIVDANLESGQITVGWHGNIMIFDLEDIGRIIGIPVRENTYQTRPFEEYMLIMGRSCVSGSDRGLKGSSTFRNVYATCRWINTNILGSSKTSSFFIPTLSIVHALMIRDRSFCIVRQLFHSIVFSHTRAHENAALVLPCIVTLLCKEMMTDHEFGMYDNERVDLRIPLMSGSYGNNVHDDWIPEILEEHVRETEEMDIDDDTYFRQATPSPSKEGMSQIWGGLKRISKMLDRIENALGCSSRSTGNELRRDRARRR